MDKNKIFNEIADFMGEALNDSGELDNVYKNNGCENPENLPEDIKNFSIVVLSDKDFKRIKELFPDIILGVY